MNCRDRENLADHLYRTSAAIYYTAGLNAKALEYLNVCSRRSGGRLKMKTAKASRLVCSEVYYSGLGENQKAIDALNLVSAHIRQRSSSDKAGEITALGNLSVVVHIARRK